MIFKEYKITNYTLLCLFVIFLSVCFISSSFILGKIFGLLLVIIFFVIGGYLWTRISKSYNLFNF